MESAKDAKAFQVEYDARLIKVVESVKSASEEIMSGAKAFKAEYEAKLTILANAVERISREVSEADKMQHEQLNNAVKALAGSILGLDRNVTTLVNKLDRNEQAAPAAATSGRGRGLFDIFRRSE